MAYRINRKDPQPMADVVSDFIKELKLASGVNTRCIFKAWDDVSGAEAYTSARFFRDGVLYVTMRSSVVRNTLFFQTDALIAAMNEKLSEDPILVRDDEESWKIKKIVLK